MRQLVVIVVTLIMLLASLDRSNAEVTDSLRAQADFSKDGIGIIVSLTPDRNIFEEWVKPRMPKITTSTSYKRGGHLVPLIIYSFDSHASAPYPALSYNITIFKPDGTVYGHFENLAVFDGGAVAPQTMYLVKQPIELGIEQSDPIGIYKIQIVIFLGSQEMTNFSDLAFEVTQ